MCNTSEAHLQYKRGCAVRIREITSTRHDVQEGQGISSVEMECAARKRHIISTIMVDHQVLVQGITVQKYFPMNESLLLLVHQVKMVSSL